MFRNIDVSRGAERRLDLPQVTSIFLRMKRLFRFFKSGCLFVAGFCLFLSLEGFAQENKAFASKRWNLSLENRILLADCSVESFLDENQSLGKQFNRNLPLLCIQASGFAETMVLKTNDSERTFALTGGRLYTGLHITRKISVHTDVFHENFNAVNEPDQTVDRLSYTESLYMQWGETAMDFWSLQLGRLHGLYGLEDRQLTRISETVLGHSDFWAHEAFGLKLQYDNRISTRHEFSIVESDDPIQSNVEKKSEYDNRQFLLRSSFDAGAFEGFRFGVSLLADRVGERRVGTHFIVLPSVKDRVTFEWVRRYSSPSLGSPSTQIFVFNVDQKVHPRHNVVFSYESTQNDYRMGMLKWRNWVPNFGTIDMNFAYLNYWDNQLGDGYMISASVIVKI